jgi:hypothetical protein
MVEKTGALILVFLIVWGWFGSFSITFEKASNMSSFSSELITEPVTKHKLNFLDGMNNSSIMLGSAMSEFLKGFLFDYTTGFFEKNNIFLIILWAIFGLVYTFVVNLCTQLFLLIVVFFSLLIIKTSFLYHLGFIFTTLLIAGVFSLFVDEENDTAINQKDTAIDQNESSEIETYNENES